MISNISIWEELLLEMERPGRILKLIYVPKGGGAGVWGGGGGAGGLVGPFLLWSPLPWRRNIF